MSSDGLSQASRSSSLGSFAVGLLVGGSLAAGAAYAGYRVLQAHGTEVASPSRKGESSFRSHRQAQLICTRTYHVQGLTPSISEGMMACAADFPECFSSHLRLAGPLIMIEEHLYRRDYI